MEKNLYIDASHPDETRIVLRSNNSIEEYEYENKNKVNFKNNIYLVLMFKAFTKKRKVMPVHKTKLRLTKETKNHQILNQNQFWIFLRDFTSKINAEN